MQLFLIESAQSGSLRVLRSGLDQDHLWCWLRKGASSAGTQGEHCSISPAKYPRLFDMEKHLIVGKKKKKIWALGIIAVYGFSVDGDKSCELL